MENLEIFLLAAGHNRDAERPCSLWSFNNGNSILDWQTHAFEKAFPNGELNIVVGYDYERILASYPHLNFSHVLNWEKSSALQSFFEVRHDVSAPAIAMYGDTVFHAETLSQFVETEGDLVVAIDSVWKERFFGRSEEDILKAETLDFEPYGEVEYAGLIKFSPKVMDWVLRHRENYHSDSGFIHLIHDIEKAGFNVVKYDVTGSWAEMNEPNDLVHFILGNKAETLRRIQPKLKKSKICDQLTCTWENWQKEASYVIAEIQAKFCGQKLIVRSSTIEEDSWETANAGVFESILDVDCDDFNVLSKAISDVFDSYGVPSPHAQVLVQPFINNVAMSGVIFTCDLVSGTPYYVINYDDVSGRTDSITSGQYRDDLRTVIVFHHRVEVVRDIDSRLEVVIEAAKELETILGYNKLDIEFAIDKKGEIYTFQVRPIVVKHDTHEVDKKQLDSFLVSAQKQFKRWQQKSPQIVGDYTVFSGMTDWNPAEIIGNRPSMLATSLYNHMITEDIWAKQRAEFGYRDVSPAPLVHHFCFQPYVDCRASINSFIPASLPDDVASRLANVYLDLLCDNPCLHDKIELDVVFTIWTPTFWEDVKARFKNHDLPAQDVQLLEEALKKLTACALERLDNDISSIQTLKKRFSEVVKSDLSLVEKAYQLIEDCRRHGTLAFSHAARAGFVAVTLLKDLVKQGALSQERMLAFQSIVPTVAGDLQNALADHSLGLEVLVEEYGHLRPGTYDINQTAYWENPAFYFNREMHVAKQVECHDFEFTKEEKIGLQAILDALPTQVEVDGLVQYFSQAIQSREKVKFEFSRNLSVALDLLLQYGTEELGLCREEVSCLAFEDVRGLRTGQLDGQLIPQLVKLRKADASAKHLAKLPGFIASENDFFGFEQEKSQANFITQSSVVADLIFINANQNEQIDGKVVVIPNADPGFDWLFSHNIAGLITQYGGANSHMAIRCAELGIPAAIGVGDKTYEGLKDGRVMLDCYKGRLEYV